MKTCQYYLQLVSKDTQQRIPHSLLEKWAKKWLKMWSQISENISENISARDHGVIDEGVYYHNSEDMKVL